MKSGVSQQEQVDIGSYRIFKNLLAIQGDVCGDHSHQFDHLTVIMVGRANIRVGSQWYTILAPGAMLVPANQRHEIVALEDHTEFWCIFSHRNEDGSPSDTVASDRAYS
jgi:quercetin dioxygenase-like cupin family protein